MFTDLTVVENQEVGRQAPCRWPDGGAVPMRANKGVFQRLPNLGDMPHRLAGRMCCGELQMLTVVRFLMRDRCLVLLDEPSEGIALVILDQIVQMIPALKSQGVSMLLSKPSVHFAAMLANRA